MVIGGGGAARSAVYALHTWMKATKIYLVNRDKGEVDAVIDECNKRGFNVELIHIATVEQADSVDGAGAVVVSHPTLLSPKSALPHTHAHEHQSQC